MKLKSYTLGPTTHVKSQAEIATAIWHPLGVNGSCLVTITENAIVRVWELSMGNHGSFDQPTLGIDLKKLANGTSVDQDFGAIASRSCKTFSPDSFEMEVASACFGKKGSRGWSPMTLWVAMRGGDVYALCPLLPEKWSPTINLISSLSVSIVAKIAAIEDDPMVPQTEKNLAQQQLAWMSDIDSQEPLIIERPSGESYGEVFARPLHPGSIPRLQGPFEIELAPEESVDGSDELLSDIYVIGSHFDSGELSYEGDDEFDSQKKDDDGLLIDIICLVTSSGRLSICLDLDGVEAQWLPKSKSKVWKLEDNMASPSLLTFEVINVLRDTEIWEGSWPMFSDGIDSRYSFFITGTSSINLFDLTPWVSRLGAELDNASVGSDFRIGIIAKSKGSKKVRVYTENTMNNSSPFSASVLIKDADLGYFLLAASSNGPVTLNFEGLDPSINQQKHLSHSATYELEPERLSDLCEPRPVYEPALTFREGSGLAAFLDKINHSKFKRLLKEEIRCSPAMLSIMTEAHKVLSEETHRIGTGAAELFRRCERLQMDLIGHIRKANEVSKRIDAVTGIDRDDKTKKSRQAIIEERLEATVRRQNDLSLRMEALRMRVSRGTCLPLSEREKSWIEEVRNLEAKIVSPIERNETIVIREPWARYAEVCNLTEELFHQITQFKGKQEPLSPQLKIPTDIKRQKLEMVHAAIDRESALVEAAKERLEKLMAS